MPCIRWQRSPVRFPSAAADAAADVGSGLVISWPGMRGIVSLAAALALPAAFPYRDLIVLTAFSVVLGTLVIQGLTLKPLLRALNLRDDDPVGREVSGCARTGLAAGLTTLDGDHSPASELVRQRVHRAARSRTRRRRRKTIRRVHATATPSRKPSRRAPGGARDARQRRDRRRCVSPARRGAGPARDRDEPDAGLSRRWKRIRYFFARVSLAVFSDPPTVHKPSALSPSKA